MLLQAYPGPTDHIAALGDVPNVEMSTRSSKLRDARMHSPSPSAFTTSPPISPAAPMTSILPKNVLRHVAARMQTLQDDRKRRIRVQPGSRSRGQDNPAFDSTRAQIVKRLLRRLKRSRLDRRRRDPACARQSHELPKLGQ